MGDMDSGNSASLQSSSGGGDDQEFDSRCPGKSYPAYLNQVSMPHFDNIINHGSLNLNPFYNNINNNFSTPTLISQSSNNNNNNICGDNNNNDFVGMMWPNKYSLGDRKNCTTMGPTAGYSSVPIPSNKAPPGSSDKRGSGEGGRNPKKRSRASRRAPTTVLATDTNNFRQMVQEFTGIPAPPFSGRSRLDLFGGSGSQFPRSIISGGGGGGGGGGLFDVSSLGMQSPPYYLLRPFPQKVVPILVEPSNQSGNPQISITSSLGPNATGSLINEVVALGHTNNATTVTSTAIAATTNNTAVMTSIGSGSVVVNDLNQECVPLQRQLNCSVDGGGDYGGNALENRGGSAVSRSEGGMVDYSSWICSSD